MNNKNKILCLLVVQSLLISIMYAQTTNYIPKYSSSGGGAIDNSIIYQSDSKYSIIGINATTSNARLEIRNTGSLPVSSTLLIVKNDNSGDQTGSMTADIDFFLWDSNTRLSIPQARIGVIGNDLMGQDYEAGGTMCFSTSNADYSTPGLTERMRILPDGKIGIGITTPSTILHVSGGSGTDIATFQNSTNGAKIVFYGGTSSAVIRNTSYGKDFELSTTTTTGSTNQNQVLLSNNKKVGLGIGKPTAHFEIYNGTLKISGGNSNQEDNARFVVDPGPSYAHRFLEFRNNQGVQMIVNGDGKIYVKAVIARLSSPLGDFVFDNDYTLMNIYDLESYVTLNKHLPGVPSASEVKENGINSGDMDNILLQKIEELTLYVIDQREQLESIQSKINLNNDLK